MPPSSAKAGNGTEQTDREILQQMEIVKASKAETKKLKQENATLKTRVQHLEAQNAAHDGMWAVATANLMVSGRFATDNNNVGANHTMTEAYKLITELLGDEGLDGIKNTAKEIFSKADTQAEKKPDEQAEKQPGKQAKNGSVEKKKKTPGDAKARHAEDDTSMDLEYDSETQGRDADYGIDEDGDDDEDGLDAMDHDDDRDEEEVELRSSKKLRKT